MKAPTSLIELQEKIQQAVQKNHSTQEALNLIARKEPLSPEERLQIYQEAYLLRMIDAMAIDFNRTHELLGEDNFANMVTQFVREQSSRHSSIAELGQHFPKFLRFYSEEWYEAASLDWLEFLSFYLEDEAKALSHEEIAQGVPFRLKLRNSTLFFQGQNKYYVSSKTQNDQQFVQEIEAKDFYCLQELKSPHGLEQFHALLQRNAIDLETAQQKIISWLSQGILQCEVHHV